MARKLKEEYRKSCLEIIMEKTQNLCTGKETTPLDPGQK